MFSLPDSLSVSFTQESSCSLLSKDNFYHLLNITTPYTFTLSSNQTFKMATKNPASESPSGKETTNVPRSDCPSADDIGCLDNSFNTFTLDFCNIRGLRSNFQSVEQHLCSTKPHLLFLTETQLFVTTESSPYSVPSYFLYTHFQSKGDCCAYVRNDITCFRAHNFESKEFSTIWLRLQCHSLTKFNCAVYLAPM